MTTTPIGSLEQIMGARGMRAFLDAQAVDVAIIDPQWNGLFEAVKMARLAAHYCAVIPNLRIMEHEGDAVPWADRC